MLAMRRCMLKKALFLAAVLYSFSPAVDQLQFKKRKKLFKKLLPLLRRQQFQNLKKQKQ